VSQAEDLLERGAGLLVVVASESEKAARIVEKAHERGVKVVAYDRLIRNCELDLYITYDYQRVGEVQARYMMKKVPVGRYLLLGGSPADQTALWLREGQLNVIHPLKKAGIIQTIEDRWVQGWDPDVAYRQMKEVLKESDGKLDAVIASNDGTAGGCIRALIESRLAGKIPVAGMDADLAACQRIVAGTQAMTIYMPIHLEAVRAAEVAVLSMKGEDIPGLDKTINNGMIEVPVIFLKPVRVDKENLDEVIIKEGFHSREDVYQG
jgi:D-xylose transport system substrate-binding protein